MLPSTTERVPQHTRQRYNEAIRRRTEEDIARYGAAGLQTIESRLRELDREWDIERALEANAAGVSLAGLALGAAVDRRLLLLPALVAGFLLQHALQGWCPPVPLFRRLGFRTAREIDNERCALKALRGDFEDLAAQPNAGDRAAVQRVLQAAER
jgi:hypothetical protein